MLSGAANAAGGDVHPRQQRGGIHEAPEISGFLQISLEDLDAPFGFLDFGPKLIKLSLGVYLDELHGGSSVWLQFGYSGPKIGQECQSWPGRELGMAVLELVEMIEGYGMMAEKGNW